MQTTTRSPSYLVKDPYSYYFRMKISKDLQPTITRKELRYSLKTGNLSDAKNKARIMAGKVLLFFRAIQKGRLSDMELSSTQIQNMIKKFRDRTIESYDKPALYDQYDEDIIRQAHWDGRSVKDEIKELEWIKDDLNTQIHKGDYSDYEKETDRLLREENIPDSKIDKSSPEYAKLCHGLLRAEIKGIKHQLKRLHGQYDDNLEDMLEGKLPETSTLLKLCCMG